MGTTIFPSELHCKILIEAGNSREIYNLSDFHFRLVFDIFASVKK